jgi:glycosyltransferase involved in cell wall biosynthesis
MLRTSRKVAQISFFNDPGDRLPEELLVAWPSLVDVADAVCEAGGCVSVLQACAHSQHLVRNGVHYFFLPFGRAPGSRGHDALGELLRTLTPDVCHVHGLDFHPEVLALAALAPRIPIVLQDHASRAPRLWRRPLWRRGLSVASGITFCSLEQARPFVDAGLIDSKTELYAIPESTSRFSPGDQADARRRTSIIGDPAVLWVGHLDVNKDPLTVLRGIRDAARVLPDLQLYCCFGTAPLLGEVEECIAQDLLLRERVHLLGRVPHERVEHLMRAADLFVLGSHREGSGFSLIEALACGLPPVVTDIPSFRSLTAAGTVGMLWPYGDSRALCASLVQSAARVGPDVRAAVRVHFERELSFAALGSKLCVMYQDLIERKRSTVLFAGVADPDAALRIS